MSMSQSNQPPETSVVYTGGTFDIFHIGHVNLLKACARIGRVVVGLNTDEFIIRYKGEYPIVPYKDREATLLACRYVAAVIPNVGCEDSRAAILASGAQFVVIGSDWVTKDYYKQMGFTQEWLDRCGIQLLYVPYTIGISSTKLRRNLCE